MYNFFLPMSVFGVDHIWCWSYLVISHLKGISLFFNQWTQKKRNSFIFVTPRFFSEFVKKSRNSPKHFCYPQIFFHLIFCQRILNFKKFFTTPRFFFYFSKILEVFTKKFSYHQIFFLILTLRFPSFEGGSGDSERHSYWSR